MSRFRGSRRYAAILALTAAAGGCAGDSTAPGAADEVVVVSLVGIGADDEGIVLRLSGGVEHIEPARHSLDVAWARDERNQATVVILGRLAEGNDVVVVRRVAGLVPLRAELVEVATTDGGVSAPPSVLATVRRGSPR